MCPFTLRQLFNLQLATIEKRLTVYYEETADFDMVIRVAVVLNVRNNLSAERFAELPAKRLIRRLCQADDIQLTPWILKLMVHFRSYFTVLEWRQLVCKAAVFKRLTLGKKIAFTVQLLCLTKKPFIAEPAFWQRI